MTPFLVAASQSILSTPVPARPMIFKLDAAAMTSAVTLVAERTMRPSYFCNKDTHGAYEGEGTVGVRTHREVSWRNKRNNALSYTIVLQLPGGL